MKLLLDQGLSRGAVALLRALGHDVRRTSDVGLASADDVELLALARASGWVIVTFDADFDALLATSNAAGPSVIRLRVEGLRGPALASLVNDVVTACAGDLDGGAAAGVEAAMGSPALLTGRSRVMATTQTQRH